MIALLLIVLRPWRVVRGALGAAAGLALAASASTAQAAVHTAAVTHATTFAASAAAKRPIAKASSKTAKATKKARRASTHAGRHAVKASRAKRRRRHERRPAERPHTDVAPDVSTMPLPVVALPELALAPADPAAPGAARTMFTVITRSATSLLDGLVARARSQLGTRYVYGGANPGDALDCSSFARYVMEALNVRLPRTANQQAQAGRPVPRDPSQLRPGDLLTFGSRGRTSHVGIYLGEGRFIHASVKSGQVIETTIERNRSLFRRWQGARRLLAGADPDTSSAIRDAASGG